jgi:chromosome segregation ATPase
MRNKELDLLQRSGDDVLRQLNARTMEVAAVRQSCADAHAELDALNKRGVVDRAELAALHRTELVALQQIGARQIDARNQELRDVRARLDNGATQLDLRVQELQDVRGRLDALQQVVDRGKAQTLEQSKALDEMTARATAAESLSRSLAADLATKLDQSASAVSAVLEMAERKTADAEARAAKALETIFAIEREGLAICDAIARAMPPKLPPPPPNKIAPSADVAITSSKFTSPAYADGPSATATTAVSAATAATVSAATVSVSTVSTATATTAVSAATTTTTVSAAAGSASLSQLVHQLLSEWGRARLELTRAVQREKELRESHSISEVRISHIKREAAARYDVLQAELDVARQAKSAAEVEKKACEERLTPLRGLVEKLRRTIGPMCVDPECRAQGGEPARFCWGVCGCLVFCRACCKKAEQKGRKLMLICPICRAAPDPRHAQLFYQVVFPVDRAK